MARVDYQLSPYAERSYSEIGRALGMSKQLVQIVATKAMRKLQRARHKRSVQRLLETARELGRLREQRAGNRPWDAPDAEMDL